MDSIHEYICLLSDGDELHIFAEDAEQAAWDALQLAQDSGEFLVDVKPIFNSHHERQQEEREVFSK